MNGWMSSAAATSWISTPGKLLNFTAVALNRSPYFAIFRGPAFATTHLRAVSPRCQLIRGKLGVGLRRAVRPQVPNAGNRRVCRSHFVAQILNPRIRKAPELGDTVLGEEGRKIDRAQSNRDWP